MSRPFVAKFSDTYLRIVERLHGLDEVKVPVALHLVDAKWQMQPNSDWGQPTRRDSGAIIARIAYNAAV
jgi:hypothetical protein